MRSQVHFLPGVRSVFVGTSFSTTPLPQGFLRSSANIVFRLGHISEKAIASPFGTCLLDFWPERFLMAMKSATLKLQSN